MMLTTRLGYGCAGAGAAQTRPASKAASTPRTRRIGHLFRLTRQRSLRLRYHGQQEIRRLVGAEVECVPARENISGAGVRIGMDEWPDALHGIRRSGEPGIGAVIFVIAPAHGERDAVAGRHDD